MTDIIAERTLQYRDGETTRPVTVRIHRPERHPDERVEAWTCQVTWDGLDIAPRSGLGVDSAEALFNALDIVGEEVKQREDLRFADDRDAPGERWNPWPIERGPAALPIPEPLPGDVISERMLASPGSSELNALVAVHLPQPKGAGEWVCWYEIRMPGEPTRRYRGVGFDSTQALFHALARIKSDIELRALSHPHAKNPWEIRLESLDE